MDELLRRDESGGTEHKQAPDDHNCLGYRKWLVIKYTIN